MRRKSVFLQTVAVFAGRRSGHNSAYAHAAQELGWRLATAGVRIVYGGGRAGLMGQMANAALSAGGQVVGIIPKFLLEIEEAHSGLSDLQIVDTAHARKAAISRLVEAFVALPGGIGTLEEIFEVWTWRDPECEKPMLLLNAEKFWNPLLSSFDHLVASGFLDHSSRSVISVARDGAELIDLLRNHSRG